MYGKFEAYAKTISLLTILTLILVGIGYAIGGISIAIYFLFLGLILNLIMYFVSDKIVLASSGARIVNDKEAPRLHKIVGDLSNKIGIPKPKVAIVNAPQPNAFATGRGPSHAVVAATTGLLAMMNDDEIEAVMAHELGHVINRDVLVSTIAAGIATAITYIAYFALFFLIGGRNNNNGAVLGLAAVILAPFTASLIQLAISRTREYLADYTSAKITMNPQALISALTKIENMIRRGAKLDASQTTASLWIANPFKHDLSSNRIAELFSTHPSTENRIKRLKEIAREMGIYID
jgi:Zn-dependent protease with chaperone function